MNQAFFCWVCVCVCVGGVGTLWTKQVQALTLCFSRETVTIVDNLGLSADQRRRADTTVSAIQQYVEGQVNESMERRNFRKRTNTTTWWVIDDFLVALRELAKTCKFCTEDCTQKNIRDQVIEGILNGDTTEELLKVRDLTLDDTIAKCRASEAAKKQRAEMSHVWRMTRTRTRYTGTSGHASSFEPTIV